LKKGSKKLLIISGAASPDRAMPGSQEFLGSFFKKEQPFYEARGEAP
jgi:hypothetical protein